MQQRRTFVESSEDRAPTRRRVIARGSEPPHEKKVRTRAAVVMKSGRALTETVIVDPLPTPTKAATTKPAATKPAAPATTPPKAAPQPKTTSTSENTKPTRQLQGQDLFALLESEPYAEVTIARRDTHRTRRLQILDSELVELGPDGTRTGQIPLCDWTPARTPSIDIASDSGAEKRHYRRGLVMGAAIATFVAAALAVAFALLV